MTITMKKILNTIPSAILSRAFGTVADMHFPAAVQKIVNKGFARLAHVDTEEMSKPLEQYESLNELFTRTLKDGARKIEDADVVSPVDGKLSFFGKVSEGMLVEAKGREYEVDQLIGCTSCAAWADSAFAFTIYLSPSNYHRIHSPASGVVTHMSYAPGRLLPVNRIGYMLTDDLLPMNERLTSVMTLANGRHLALVKVGATCVGRISVVYDDFKTNDSMHRTPLFKELDSPSAFAAGDMLGCFELGSTVVVIVESEGFVPDSGLEIGKKLRMGQAIGRWEK